MSALSSLLTALVISHPGHGPAAPECREEPGLCPLELVETTGNQDEAVARMMLDQGLAKEAVRTIYARALVSPEAAKILAEALDQLGDPQGAANARARAKMLSR